MGNTLPDDFSRDYDREGGHLMPPFFMEYAGIFSLAYFKIDKLLLLLRLVFLNWGRFMENLVYVAPAIEIIEVEIEQGFAATTVDFTVPSGIENYPEWLQ